MDEAVETQRDSSGQAPMARVGETSGEGGRLSVVAMENCRRIVVARPQGCASTDELVEWESFAIERWKIKQR